MLVGGDGVGVLLEADVRVAEIDPDRTHIIVGVADLHERLLGLDGPCEVCERHAQPVRRIEVLRVLLEDFVAERVVPLEEGVLLFAVLGVHEPSVSDVGQCEHRVLVVGAFFQDIFEVAFGLSQVLGLQVQVSQQRLGVLVARVDLQGLLEAFRCLLVFGRTPGEAAQTQVRVDVVGVCVDDLFVGNFRLLDAPERLREQCAVVLDRHRRLDRLVVFVVAAAAAALFLVPLRGLLFFGLRRKHRLLERLHRTVRVAELLAQHSDVVPQLIGHRLVLLVEREHGLLVLGEAGLGVGPFVALRQLGPQAGLLREVLGRLLQQLLAAKQLAGLQIQRPQDAEGQVVLRVQAVDLLHALDGFGRVSGEDRGLAQPEEGEVVVGVEADRLGVELAGLARLALRMERPADLVEALRLGALAAGAVVRALGEGLGVLVLALVEQNERQQVEHHGVLGVELVCPLQQPDGLLHVLRRLLVHEDGRQPAHGVDVVGLELQRALEGLARRVLPAEAEETQPDSDSHRGGRVGVDPQHPFVEIEGFPVLFLVELGARHAQDGRDVGLVDSHGDVEAVGRLLDVFLREQKQAPAHVGERVVALYVHGLVDEFGG
mmetsp:Transcript_5408/g.9951  ORF Transcript_5408/g.9951 Transcript_5408/m.9951 type:complete len:602 (-) Transcript_5408:492-2297(-)